MHWWAPIGSLGRALVARRAPSTLHPLTLHLNGFTGRCTIMCVLSVCFWMKLLKQTWHWKGLTLLWISMCLFRLAESVNSREHTSHLWPFMPCTQEESGLQCSVIVHPAHSCPTCGKAACERDLLRRGETNTIHCARWKTTGTQRTLRSTLKGFFSLENWGGCFVMLQAAKTHTKVNFYTFLFCSCPALYHMHQEIPDYPWAAGPSSHPRPWNFYKWLLCFQCQHKTYEQVFSEILKKRNLNVL